MKGITLHEPEPKLAVIYGLKAPAGLDTSAFFVWLARVDNRCLMRIKRSDSIHAAQNVAALTRSRNRCMDRARQCRAGERRAA